MEHAAVVGTFGWAVEDCGVLGWFDFDDAVILGSYVEFAHAVGAGEVGLPRNGACVGYDGRLVK